MKCWYPMCEDPVFMDRVCFHHWARWYRAVYGVFAEAGAYVKKNAPNADTLSA